LIKLRYAPESAPIYSTSGSSGADLKSTIDLIIPAGQRARIPTGVWIDSVDWSAVPAGQIPELQIRARSGLAFKFGLTLANGIGTVDADYPDEIGVLIANQGDKDFTVNRGDRIAQMVLVLVHRIPELAVGALRQGGFGSTGIATVADSKN